jgi:hypothetical protein
MEMGGKGIKKSSPLAFPRVDCVWSLYSTSLIRPLMDAYCDPMLPLRLLLRLFVTRHYGFRAC